MPEEDRDLGAEFEELTKDRFLIGSPDEIAEQIAGYHKRLGVNNICLGAQGVGMPQSQLLEAIQLFSEEVMPRVEQQFSQESDDRYQVSESAPSDF